MNETRAPTNEAVREQVLKAYRKGEKPKALSEKTGISVNTIKSWIKRDKAKSAASGKDAPRAKKGASPKGKKGAPFGNQNAKGGRGGAAPLRNRNAEKHGAHTKLYWAEITDEEWEMIGGMSDDEEWNLITQIKLFAIREKRLMHRIRLYTEMNERNHGLAVKSVSKKKVTEDLVDSEGKPIKDGEYKKSTETTVTNTEAVMSSIMALEAELTKVQRAKTKAIDSLSKIRLENERMGIEKTQEQREADLHELRKELLDAQIEHMDASTNKILGVDTELEDLSDTDAMIYGHGDDAGDGVDEVQT